MQIIATTDFHFGLGSSAEIIRRGDAFTPPGTGQMNAREHAQSLINCGSCCTPEDWPKVQAKTEAGHQWAKTEVARLNQLRKA